MLDQNVAVEIADSAGGHRLAAAEDGYALREFRHFFLHAVRNEHRGAAGDETIDLPLQPRTWLGWSAEVASSRISSFGACPSTLAISSICCCASDRSRIRLVGECRDEGQ